MPIFRITVESHYQEVAGFDSPGLVLYSDGTVLFYALDSVVPWIPYALSRLTPDRRDSLLAALTSDGALWQLPRDFYVGGRMELDAVIYRFYGPGAGRAPSVTARGSLWPAAEGRKNAPPPILNALDRAELFAVSHGQPWLPDSIEVLLFPYDLAPTGCDSSTTAWPAQWPRPDASLPLRVTRFWIPAARVADVASFQGRNTGQCARLRDQERTWIVGYRYPMPGDTLWRHEYP